MKQEEILNKYIQYKKLLGHSPKTLRSDRGRIQYFIKWPFIQWPDRFLDKIQNNSQYSAFTQYTVINIFLKWAVKQGYIPTNYFESIPKPKKPKLLPKTLRKEEASKILATTGSMGLVEHSVYSTFLYTGLRRGELLKLQKYQIDFDRGSFFIANAKGNKDRVVPVPDHLISLLKRIEPKGDYFFGISHDGLKHLKKKVQDQSGVSHTIHKLRHTFASLSLQSGMDLLTLQKILGHSDITTTALYLGTSIDHMKEQVNKLSFY